MYAYTDILYIYIYIYIYTHTHIQLVIVIQIQKHVIINDVPRLIGRKGEGKASSGPFL